MSSSMLPRTLVVEASIKEMDFVTLRLTAGMPAVSTTLRNYFFFKEFKQLME